MKIKTRILHVCVFLSCLATVARATLIDFETVPDQQNPQVNNQYIGDTYDSMGVNLWSKSSVHPRWKNNAYNNSGWFVTGGYSGYSGSDHIGLTFDAPVTEVSMSLFTMSSVQFWVYDTDGVPINGITSIYLGGGWKTKTITSPAGRFISRIQLQGTTTQTVVGMDNLMSVPEPATLSLLAIGGAVILRRKRRYRRGK